MKYEVGQVLYVIMSKDRSVIPVRVIEQVLRKTLDGESVAYVVELPTQSGERVSLEKLGSGIYASSDEAMSVMIKNAEDTIKNIIKKAESIAESAFNVSNDNKNVALTPAPPDLDKAPDKGGQGNIEVDLGDGIKGKVSIKELE